MRFYIRICKSTQWCKQDVAIEHVFKVECNDSWRPLCGVLSGLFPYLGRLVRNMFAWLQKSCGGGEPDAVQTRRISSPWEKAWLWGWTTTDGASAIGVKQRQNADDDSGQCCCCMMSFLTSQSQVYNSKLFNSKWVMTWPTVPLPALHVWLYCIPVRKHLTFIGLFVIDIQTTIADSLK